MNSNTVHHSQKVQTTQLSMNRWTDKYTVTCPTTKYYSALKGMNTDTCYNMNKCWKHYAKWKKPDQKKKPLTVLPPFIWNVPNRQIYKDRKATSRWNWEMTINKFPFGGMKIFWNWTVVIKAQLCKYTKNHWTVHFKMVSFFVV